MVKFRQIWSHDLCGIFPFCMLLRILTFSHSLSFAQFLSREFQQSAIFISDQIVTLVSFRNFTFSFQHSFLSFLLLSYCHNHLCLFYHVIGKLLCLYFFYISACVFCMFNISLIGIITYLFVFVVQFLSLHVQSILFHKHF